MGTFTIHFRRAGSNHTEQARVSFAKTRAEAEDFVRSTFGQLEVLPPRTGRHARRRPPVNAEPPATYSIEVPFPGDHAPYKIVRTDGAGRKRIVDSAMTREVAREYLKSARERRLK